MSGPDRGPAPESPSPVTDLVEGLDRSAQQCGQRLGLSLRRALSDHDLNRQELLAAHRDIVRLKRMGALPSPTEYWQRTALPRASTMIDASMASVVAEGQELGEALDRFLSGMATLREAGPEAAARTGDPGLEPDGAPLDLDQLSTAATGRAIDRLLEAVPSAHSIHALGSWWQRRLRRAAIVGSLPGLLTASDPDRLIGRTELSLLDGPPWCHGDRLLSAFELAHHEIRTQTELVVDGLASRVARGGRRYLRPGRRVTIELRR